MGANIFIPLVILVVVLFFLHAAKDDHFKQIIKFVKYCIIPERIIVSGIITNIYDGDNVLVISNDSGSRIVNSSLIPIYYVDVAGVDNKITTVEIRDFSFVGKLRRRIDNLDTVINLPCCRYSMSQYPFVA